MKYEEYEIVIDGIVEHHVKIEREDGSILTFPAINGNPDYEQYLVNTDSGLPLSKEAK